MNGDCLPEGGEGWDEWRAEVLCSREWAKGYPSLHGLSGGICSERGEETFVQGYVVVGMGGGGEGLPNGHVDLVAGHGQMLWFVTSPSISQESHPAVEGRIKCLEACSAARSAWRVDGEGKVDIQ